MAVTRDDVARRAGVSAAIVSYVINNGPRTVAPATRAKVLAAIHELGYNPSTIARNLRRQRTSTIGMLVPTLDVILTEVVRGALDVARQAGYRIVHYDTNHSSKEEHVAAAALISERVEGVLWIPCGEDLHVGQTLERAGVRVVMINPPRHTNAFPIVDIDNYHGGYLATCHLLELGHRRIALLDRAEPTVFSRERLRGYQAALAEHAIPSYAALIVPTEPTVEAARDVTHTLLAQPNPPSAIFAYADMLAVGVLRAAYERGLSVPGQLSVVGFDGIALAPFTCPALTTVAAPTRERGARGAQLLLDLIHQHHTEQQLKLPVQLVVRESTGPVAV